VVVEPGRTGRTATTSPTSAEPTSSTGPGTLALRLDRSDLGEVHLGPGTTAVTTTARVVNTGSGPLDGLTVRLEGSGFAVVGDSCGTSLPAGEGCDVTLAARPRSLGPVTATLTAAVAAGAVQAQVRAQGVVDVAVTVVGPPAAEGTPAPDPPEVTVLGGGGLIDCPGRCTVRMRSPGVEILTLEAVAGAGARFSGWEGSCSSSEPRCSLALTADRTVTARFTAEPPSG
jgi:hypothetical protein